MPKAKSPTPIPRPVGRPPNPAGIAGTLKVTTAPPLSSEKTLRKLGSGNLGAGVRIATTVAVRILESGDLELISRLFPEYTLN